MWQRKDIWAVGGLREIGFVHNTDILAVLSSNGIGIFDCVTHEKILRDYFDFYNEEECDVRFDHTTGIIANHAIMNGQKIQCGGFEYPDVLKKTTADGWIVQVENEIRTGYQGDDKDMPVMYLLHAESNQKIEIETFEFGINRAYGFSDTGLTFITACSSDFDIWSR